MDIVDKTKLRDRLKDEVFDEVERVIKKYNKEVESYRDTIGWGFVNNSKLEEGITSVSISADNKDLLLEWEIDYRGSISSGVHWLSVELFKPADNIKDHIKNLVDKWNNRVTEEKSREKKRLKNQLEIIQNQLKELGL